jgi:hypothetical protein
VIPSSFSCCCELETDETGAFDPRILRRVFPLEPTTRGYVDGGQPPTGDRKKEKNHQLCLQSGPPASRPCQPQQRHRPQTHQCGLGEAPPSGKTSSPGDHGAPAVRSAPQRPRRPPPRDARYAPPMSASRKTQPAKAMSRGLIGHRSRSAYFKFLLASRSPCQAGRARRRPKVVRAALVVTRRLGSGRACR